MDLIMPVMNGVKATRQIMKVCPCPVLLVTATVDGNSSLVFEAMGAGALDVVATPVHAGGRELLRKIDRIARIIGGADERTSSGQTVRWQQEGPSPGKDGTCLVAIGSSTGGPQALQVILRGLPADFPAAIAVVQHMDEQFASGLAGWLDGQCRLQVRVLREGDGPLPGQVLIASTNNHLIMRADGTFGYAVEPEDSYYHPSVDVFFNSLVQNWRNRCIGVILTGMGSDGARGLSGLRRQGQYTITQDRKSSVVFGMPKAAIELNAAREILPVDQISGKIINLLAAAGRTKDG
jgi:chemotaxis response regulator CheB